ncbi:MAG TPA: hypothetical protein VFJ30_17370 [Phycisphaerae bacterium]|nr:hypothetical protein [Phycisphaerae bacterium]
MDHRHHDHLGAVPAGGVARMIGRELAEHVPFTVIGAATGVVVAVVFLHGGFPAWWSARLFEVFHPLHVMLSAVVTAAMYRLHTKGGIVKTVLIGYVGSVGIGTLSDCLLPYAGELLLAGAGGGGHIDAHAHIGFIEEWWLVNPLALLGVAIAIVWPRTKLPHAGHVLLSTWASLFHMLMAMSGQVAVWMYAAVAGILFVAVWVPCCASDIVFPLLFAPRKAAGEGR